MKSLLLPLLAPSALALSMLAGCRREQEAPVPPVVHESVATPADAPAATPAAGEAAVGEAAMPALEVTTVDGKAWDLAAHRGKWVVVNFWATWCGPCLKEMPDLSALDAMREQVEVIGLAYEEIEPAELQAFLKAHPVVYPIAIVDVYDPPADFATPRGLPMTYLIAPDGKVARHFLGPVTAAEIDAVIAAAPSAT